MGKYMSEAMARKIFARTKYQATDEDIQRLSKNIALLGSRGLDSLNKRLIEGGRKVWDTIAEHNFASQLALSQNSSVPIQYEPPEIKPPPDFKIEKEGIIYWLQMKKLAESERENRQKKIMKQIERMAEDIK